MDLYDVGPALQQAERRFAGRTLFGPPYDDVLLFRRGDLRGCLFDRAGAAADHRNPAGADQFDNAKRPHQVDEGLDLSLLPGNLDDDFVWANVDDPAAENPGQLADAAAATVGVSLDLDQHQIALDEVLRANVIDPDDCDDLSEL